MLAAGRQAAACACLAALVRFLFLVDRFGSESAALKLLGLALFSRRIYHEHACRFADVDADPQIGRLVPAQHNHYVRLFGTQAGALAFLRQTARPELRDSASFQS